MSKRKGSTSLSQPATKRAKWTTEQTSLLKQQLEAGESVATVAKLFPQFTVPQVHSKVSNLKKQGVLKSITSSGIAPSLTEGSSRKFKLTF